MMILVLRGDSEGMNLDGDFVGDNAPSVVPHVMSATNVDEATSVFEAFVLGGGYSFTLADDHPQFGSRHDMARLPKPDKIIHIRMDGTHAVFAENDPRFQQIIDLNLARQRDYLQPTRGMLLIDEKDRLFMEYEYLIYQYEERAVIIEMRPGEDVRSLSSVYEVEGMVAIEGTTIIWMYPEEGDLLPLALPLGLISGADELLTFLNQIQ